MALPGDHAGRRRAVSVAGEALSLAFFLGSPADRVHVSVRDRARGRWCVVADRRSAICTARVDGSSPPDAAVPADGDVRPARDSQGRPARARRFRLRDGQHPAGDRHRVRAVSRRVAAGRLEDARRVERNVDRWVCESGGGQAIDRSVGQPAALGAACRRALLFIVGTRAAVERPFRRRASIAGRAQLRDRIRSSRHRRTSPRIRAASCCGSDLRCWSDSAPRGSRHRCRFR